uniref:Small hydrophobic protein n=1 Tax=Mammalian orthorubulavirus 5 TaxID=2560580 RepID=A0A6B9JHR9_9MONO|nr:small hydrophobic protein [Mammalian orthorubulavirus 5]
MLPDPKDPENPKNTKRAGNLIICFPFILFLFVTFIVPTLRHFLS